MTKQSTESSDAHAGNLTQDPPQADAVDQEQLNQLEQETLLLLAEGHTAKSIASLTGRSVFSVNERLREARRKTGVGSSRELARLLKAQKNRDEEIEVACGSTSDPWIGADAIVASADDNRKIGAIVMFALAIAGVAAALLIQATPEAPTSNNPGQPAKDVLGASSASAGDDPLLDLLAKKEDGHPSQLYQRVRLERKDPAWATRAEEALRARYERLLASGQVEGLRVLCASSICEVTGSIVAKSEAINVTMQDIQDYELNETVGHAGLRQTSAAFGGRPNSSQSVFATYWLRSST